MGPLPAEIPARPCPPTRAPRGCRRRDAERRARAAEREHEKELELIKIQYLGKKKEKKKIAKPSDKFKFNFDWAADEDTSRDLNPIYNNPHEAALLFGRGLVRAAAPRPSSCPR